MTTLTNSPFRAYAELVTQRAAVTSALRIEAERAVQALNEADLPFIQQLNAVQKQLEDEVAEDALPLLELLHGQGDQYFHLLNFLKFAPDVTFKLTGMNSVEDQDYDDNNYYTVEYNELTIELKVAGETMSHGHSIRLDNLENGERLDGFGLDFDDETEATVMEALKASPLGLLAMLRDGGLKGLEDTIRDELENFLLEAFELVKTPFELAKT